MFFDPSIRRQVGRYLKIFIHSLGEGRQFHPCLVSHCLAGQLIELFSVSVENQIWALDAVVRLFRNILNGRFLVCNTCYMSVFVSRFTLFLRIKHTDIKYQRILQLVDIFRRAHHPQEKC